MHNLQSFDGFYMSLFLQRHQISNPEFLDFFKQSNNTLIYFLHAKLCIGDGFLKFFVFATSIVRSRSCLLNGGRCDCGCVVHSMDVKRIGKEAFQWCRYSWKKWISNPIGPGDVYTPCPAFGNNLASWTVFVVAKICFAIANHCSCFLSDRFMIRLRLIGSTSCSWWQRPCCQ